MIHLLENQTKPNQTKFIISLIVQWDNTFNIFKNLKVNVIFV